MILNNSDLPSSPSEIFQLLKPFPIGLLKIYPRSFCTKNGIGYGLIRTREDKKCVVLGERPRVLKDAFQGDCHHQTLTLKVCDLSPENTKCLMALFPYTKPISLRKYPMTIGMGDPLGLATPGQIRAITKYQAYPVLTQQPVMENTQIKRNFFEMIQNAAWAVFQEGYQEGYGADGDRLKSPQEVKRALDAGASMVTLDPSDKLNHEAFQEQREQIHRKFKEEIDPEDAKVIFHLFLDKEFVFNGPEGGFSICFDEEGVERNTLFFYKALDFIEEVYQLICSKTGNRPLVDFEISMDEMPFPISPESHFFFTLELSHRGVHLQSFAPRFNRKFERGIDDPGEREVFRRHFYQHILIAQNEGNYKISIRSGSDRLFLLPDMGELSQGSLHLKISEMGWLEAMRLIALRNPSLYKEINHYALTKFKGLSNLYVLHAKDEDGRNTFRDPIYRTLMQYEEEYWSLIEKQFEKYLSALGAKKRKN
jgi:hypothetical protein